MAKVSVIERNKKRQRVVMRWQKRRTELKAIIKSAASAPEQVEEAIENLKKLPRNASPCRLRNRCALTGRGKGYYRKFGLGRNKLREYAMAGDIPGLVKSSW